MGKKKPIYKKWWFWTIIIVLVLIILFLIYFTWILIAISLGPIGSDCSFDWEYKKSTNRTVESEEQARDLLVETGWLKSTITPNKMDSEQITVNDTTIEGYSYGNSLFTSKNGEVYLKLLCE